MTALVLASVLAALGCLTGCGSGASADAGPAAVNLDDLSGAPGVRGVSLSPVVRMPAVTLTDTAGAPFALPARTAGKLALVFFGYTNCPDVCPTTVADLAAALTRIPAADRSRVMVLFVTTDPTRDTGPVLHRWLNQFDGSFIGLTGPAPAVARLAAATGVTFSTPAPQADGSITVTHGSQVTAVSPDGTARVGYQAGADVADYAHDIPLLLAGES